MIEKLNAKLLGWWTEGKITYDDYMDFQPALRVAAEAELIINQVESINLNGEGK